MALANYVLCTECNCKLVYTDGHSEYGILCYCENCWEKKGNQSDKWKSLAGELVDALEGLRNSFPPRSMTVEMINEVLTKAREAGL